MNTLGLHTRPDRCAHGFAACHHPRFCTCAGLKAKAAGQARATAAHPDERAAVESAIRELAATGRPFSANDARALHGVKGGVVGATFTALKNAKVIAACGDDTSSSESTHGHRIFLWRGVAA